MSIFGLQPISMTTHQHVFAVVLSLGKIEATLGHCRLPRLKGPEVYVVIASKLAAKGGSFILGSTDGDGGVGGEIRTFEAL